MDELVHYRVERQVAWLTIDRPEARNALERRGAVGTVRGAWSASTPTTRPGCWS